MDRHIGLNSKRIEKNPFINVFVCKSNSRFHNTEVCISLTELLPSMSTSDYEEERPRGRRQGGGRQTSNRVTGSEGLAPGSLINSGKMCFVI